MAIMGMGVLAISVLQPILPLYLASIGVVPTILGLMFSVAMIGMVFGESTGGWIADRVGLRVPLSVGTFVCAPVVLCFVLTRSTLAIFLIFFFWGVVRSAIFGPGRGYIGATAPLAQKATFMAIFAATLAVSRSIGSAMSGFIVDTWGYHRAFFISAGISILGGAAVVGGLRRVRLVRSDSRTVPPSLSVAPRPRNPARSYRPVVFQGIVAALEFLSGGIMFTFLPLLAAQEVGLAATQVGVLFTIGGLVTAVLLMPMGRLADRKGKKLLMLIGLLVSAGGMAGLAFARNFPGLILFVAARSLGMAMFSPAAVALLSDTMPPDRQATAMGVYGSCEDIGVITGSALGGLIWSTLGPQSTFLMGAIAGGLGAAVCLTLIGDRGTQGAAATPGHSATS